VQHDLHFSAVVRDKMRLVEEVQARNKAEPKYRYNENEIYDELVSQLFKTAFHQADRFELVFAGRGKRNRTAALNDEFAPHRLYFWIENLFAEYRKAHEDRPVLTTHMFRKRAFTMAWQAGIDVRHASIAYGCNVDTLMKHYIALDEQQVTDDVFAKMAKPKGA
jgi:hypothetical protein